MADEVELYHETNGAIQETEAEEGEVNGEAHMNRHYSEFPERKLAAVKKAPKPQAEPKTAGPVKETVVAWKCPGPHGKGYQSAGADSVKTHTVKQGCS